MSRACRRITGLIVLSCLFFASDSISQSSSGEVDGHDLKSQYRLLLEERSRLLKRNRFLLAELRLALSNEIYLVVPTQAPAIQLKTQATLLEEYEVDDLHMDRMVGELLAAKGFLHLSLRDIREVSLDPRSDLAEPRESSPVPEEDRSTSARDSLSSQPRTLYALNFDQDTTLYVQRPRQEQRESSGRERSLLGILGRWFSDAWSVLWSPRKRIYVAVDEPDAMRLLRSVRVGMDVLVVE